MAATTMEQNGLSGRDLRIKLFDLMKSKGIVDNVKSHLRGRLIHELRGGMDEQIRFSAANSQPTLLVRALNALILDYFQQEKYEYTTSVFVPEANIHDHRIMSDEEILRLLNISTESTFYKKIKSNSQVHGHSSLLMSMLTCIASWLPGSSHSMSTQTSPDLWAGSVAGSTLDEKLNHLDAMYTDRREDLSSMHNLSTEEKLLLFQKNIELRTQENLKQQMEQFRENEMKKIREEERQKCQLELQSLRKELETLYKSKHETLNEKEMRIGDRFKAELDNERRDLFTQRQTFLEELKSLKLRETEQQRNLELRERSVALETDRLKRLEEDLRKREGAVSNTELQVDQQVQHKLHKLRFEIEQQFTERDKNLQLIEMRNQEEARRLSEERLLAEQAKSEVSSLRKHYSEADTTIHRLQSENRILQNENDILRDKTRQVVDYQSIREENAILKSQINHRTSRHHSGGSSSSTPRYSKELQTVLDKQSLGQQVVNDELVDLKTQIALLQSSNEPQPYYNGRFASNAGGDYLSRVLKSASDVQLNQSRYSNSSNYNQFIEDARLRMLELDREADKVEQSYRDYQHRVLTKSSQANHIPPTELDYSSGRRMPSVKLSAQTQGTTPTHSMPSATSLQDLSSHTQKFNWNQTQPLINLPESLLASKTASGHRPKNLSHSDDRIFEHPEVTIKPSTIDERAQRRLLITTKGLKTNEHAGGSVPNILEHPDIQTPIVRKAEQLSLSSASSSPSSSGHSAEKRKFFRQQSADVYSTLARTTTASPPAYQSEKNTPGSYIGDIVESPEPEKSEDSSSTSTPPPPAKAPITTIIREYSEASSTSDIDATTKHSNHTAKPQSEEDDFW